MKKLLIVLLLVLGLGACSPSPDQYSKSDIDSQINDLQLQIDALNERFDGLSIVYGLNGQHKVYEQGNMQTMSAQVEFMKDTFDKTKAPSYLIDDNGEYVSMNELFYKLKLKYFNDSTIESEDLTSMGSKAFFRFVFYGNFEKEEIIARTILLIEELRNYEFYILSCPELDINVIMHNNGVTEQVRIKIPLVVMINDMFQITPDGIVDGDYEMQLLSDAVDLAVIQSYYDFHVSKNTFNGYVLNWE